MYISTVVTLLSAAAMVCSAKCSPGPPPFPVGDFSKHQTTAKGREYVVHLPKQYDPTKPMPLILSYHGAGRTIENQIKLDGLTDPSRNSEYIVAYLQALSPEGSDKTEWQVAPGAEHIDDVGFTADVLTALESSLCVDSRRIYATGKSQGGGFVGQVLACDAEVGGRFAAFAPVSGAYYIKDTPQSACEPTTHVPIPCAGTQRKDTPIMAFHGGADDVIPYRGTWRRGTNSCLPDVRHWARQWVARDGLQDTQRNTTIPGSRNGIRSTWSDGRVVLVYDGDDIGHDWPSTAVNSDNKGKPRAAFNASDDILEWFGKWKL